MKGTVNVLLLCKHLKMVKPWASLDKGYIICISGPKMDICNSTSLDSHALRVTAKQVLLLIPTKESGPGLKSSTIKHLNQN